MLWGEVGLCACVEFRVLDAGCESWGGRGGGCADGRLIWDVGSAWTAEIGSARDGSRDPGSPAGSLFIDQPKAAHGTNTHLHEATTSSGPPRPTTPTDSSVGMTKAHVPDHGRRSETRSIPWLRLKTPWLRLNTPIRLHLTYVARVNIPDRHARSEGQALRTSGPLGQVRRIRMSLGVNLSYTANHSFQASTGVTVPSAMAAGDTIPPTHPREGMGRNIIMTRRTRLHHDGVTGHNARDGA
jgi:hypothetical protein